MSAPPSKSAGTSRSVSSTDGYPTVRYATKPVRFRARIKADGLTDPVLREESTKVYGDDVR